MKVGGPARFELASGDGPDARYRNTAETARFLDRRSPQYMGFLEMANARLYRFWGDLTEALRTGEPQPGSGRRAKRHQGLLRDSSPARNIA